jgi:hypothetical protein
MQFLYSKFLLEVWQDKPDEVYPTLSPLEHGPVSLSTVSALELLERPDDQRVWA